MEASEADQGVCDVSSACAAVLFDFEGARSAWIATQAVCARQIMRCMFITLRVRAGPQSLVPLSLLSFVLNLQFLELIFFYHLRTVLICRKLFQRFCIHFHPVIHRMHDVRDLHGLRYLRIAQIQHLVVPETQYDRMVEITLIRLQHQPFIPIRKIHAASDRHNMNTLCKRG